MSAARPPVSIVVPIYGRVDLTMQCLRTVHATIDLDRDEVIVVDNGSPDDSVEVITRDAPWVQLIVNGANLGFAAGCNVGARAAKHPLLVFLNNDTEARSDWLDALVAPLVDDASVGLVGPRLLFPDGTLQHAGMLLVEDRRSGSLNAEHRWYRHAGDKPGAQRPADLKLVTGAVMAVRRDQFFEVGGFDEAYWNGCEDVELCLRIGARGFTIRYAPDSVLVHHESASGAQRWTKVTENLALLSSRWFGRVTPDVVVRADGAAFPAPPPSSSPTPSKRAARTSGNDPVVRLGGSMFTIESMAHVNRELAVRLGDHGVRVDPQWPETPTVSVADDPRLIPVVEHALGRHRGEANVTLQHRWPPRWEPPEDRSAWVVVQPFEWGALPARWVAPLRDLADEVWVYTDWLRRCAVASGVPGHKVHVVPVGIDTGRYRPDGPTFPLQTQARTRFLYVGGAVYRKGLDVLVHTYLQSFTASDDVCLVLKLFGGNRFYSDAPHRQLREVVGRPGVPAIEIIEDDLTDDEVASLYRSCTALVQPYRGEGFCMPIAEAMASGLPVVVTGAGAAMDFCDETTATLIRATETVAEVEHEDFGPSSGTYTLAEPDPGHLRRILLALHDDPASARAKTPAARQRVVRQLDWDVIAAGAAERLRQLARRRPRRFDALGAFVAEVEPVSLDDPRGTTVLLEIDADGAWRAAADAWLATVDDADELTLVVTAADERDLQEFAESSDGHDADVLAVLTGGDENRLAAAYAACDLVLTGNRAAGIERAARMGKRTLRRTNAEGLRHELARALGRQPVRPS